MKCAVIGSRGLTVDHLDEYLPNEVTEIVLVFSAVGVTLTVGTLCGYLLTTMLYRTGTFYMAFRFPTGFALAYAGVLTVIPILISILSMHSFSKEALTERLRSSDSRFRIQNAPFVSQIPKRGGILSFIKPFTCIDVRFSCLAVLFAARDFINSAVLLKMRACLLKPKRNIMPHALRTNL